MYQALLLNASYEPIKVIDWQRAMTLWYRGRAEIIHTHDREVRAVTFSFRLPSVVRLLRYVKIRRREHVTFTRANIYARDQRTCQYCGVRFPTEELTFDHVVPVAQGGTRSWDNIVAACVECNRAKGDRTPEQAGMRLLKRPTRPGPTVLLRLTVGLQTVPESWRDFLYWSVELEQD